MDSGDYFCRYWFGDTENPLTPFPFFTCVYFNLMNTNNHNSELLTRWRLILGKYSEEELSQAGSSSLGSSEKELDEALGAIYEEGSSLSPGKKNQKYGDLSESTPGLVKWLGDIREHFPEEIVAVIQKDAISRKGLDQLLYEPELLGEIEPNVELVGLLLSLKNQIPEASKNAVREVVRKVVEKIKAELEEDIRRAVSGSINRSEPSRTKVLKNLNWKKTIDRNLHNWSSEKKTIIPEKLYFHANSVKRNSWTVLVNIDQSGSMADSAIYGAVMGSIFASLPALETRVITFDTSVVDLTEECGDDPVDMLLGIQLGGGTDINRSLQFSSQFIHTPSKTIQFLITDLFEAGNEKPLLNQIRSMVESGVKVVCLLSLSNSGQPFYNEKLSKLLVEMDVPCFGCTPGKIPDLIHKVLRGNSLDSM